jgi:SAM-dependent methyltransferase
MQNAQFSRFIEILNIPSANGMTDFFKGGGDYNWYYYLYDLNIINKEIYDKILAGAGRIEHNHFLDSYLNEFTKNYVIRDSSQTETIVDLGCGWGFLAFWMAQFSGKKIYATGYPEQIEFLQKVHAIAKKKNLFAPTSEIILVSQPISLKSVILHDSIHPETIDKIILNDVIEHFHSSLYYNLGLAAYNSLKKGGVLISKSHNTENKKVLQGLQDYWKKCEENYLLEKRTGYLKAAYPNLDTNTVNNIARHTKGYTLEATLSAAAYYGQTGKTLPLNANLVPIDIQLDDYMLENYVNPKLFKTFLEFFGFKVRLYPGLYSSRRLSLFSPISGIFPSILLKIPFFSAVIIIHAIKR